VRRGGRPELRGATAGGDRALLEHPGAEPGRGGGRGQGQAEQPQEEAAEGGQRGGCVGGQGVEVLVAGEARARTTPMRVSLARAWAMGGRAQMARFRQPGSAAMAFMNTLAPTEARFSVRARSARRPCRASAMPRQAKVHRARSVAASTA
jgi:hypothetical protein